MGPEEPDLGTLSAVDVIKKADKVFCMGYLTSAVKRWAKAGSLEEIHGLAKRYYAPGWRQSHMPCDWQPDGAEAKRMEQAQSRFQTFSARVRKLVREGKTVAVADSGAPLLSKGSIHAKSNCVYTCRAVGCHRDHWGAGGAVASSRGNSKRSNKLA